MRKLFLSIPGMGIMLFLFCLVVPLAPPAVAELEAQEAPPQGAGQASPETPPAPADAAPAPAAEVQLAPPVEMPSDQQTPPQEAGQAAPEMPPAVAETPPAPPVETPPAEAPPPAEVQPPAPVDPVPPVPQQNSLSSDEQLDFANGLFTKGFYEMAEAEFHQFIVAFPADQRLQEAYFGLAESLFFRKAYAECFEAYRYFKELYPDGERSIVATMRQGQALYHQEKYDEALLHLTPVLSQALPAQFKQTLNFYLGQAYRAKGDLVRAMEYLGKAAEDTQEKTYTSRAYLEMGQLDDEASRFVEAVDRFQKAFENAGSNEVKALALYRQGEAQFLAGQYELSAEVFRRVIKEFPEEKIGQDALANLLLALSNLGRNDDVVTTFNENLPRVTDEARFFEGYFAAAQALAATNRVDEALGIFDKQLANKTVSDEQRHRILVKKAQVLVQAKRSPEAISLIESQLESSSVEPDKTVFTKAEAFYDAGEFGKAVEQYGKLLADFPASAYAQDAKYGIAHARYAAGNMEEAMNAFMDYFQTATDEGKKREALSNALSIAQKSQLDEKTIELGEQFLSAYRDDARAVEILMVLGTLYSKLNRHEQAITTLGAYAAASQDPKSLQQANFLLGYSLQALKMFDEAVAAYEKAATPPENKEIVAAALKNTALIYVEKDDKEKAVEVFDRMITEFEDPQLDPQTIVWLTGYYHQQKRFDDVLRLTQKTAGKEGNEAIAGELAYFTAEAYRAKSDFTQALPKYEEAVKALETSASPFWGAARLGKCLTLMSQQSWDLAKNELTGIVESRPGDDRLLIRARFEMGNLERARGNLDEAAKLYMLVAVLYADEEFTPRSLLNAGEILDSQDKKEEARKLYQELIEKYPQSSWAQEAQGKM